MCEFRSTGKQHQCNDEAIRNANDFDSQICVLKILMLTIVKMISPQDKALYQRMYTSLTKFVQADLNKIAEGQLSLTLPTFEPNEIISLCKTTRDLFAKEKVLLELPQQIVIIGDLHGHFLDLLRIIQTYGLPLNRRFLFLGDLVDRGEFSIETVLLVFSLKVLFSDHVYIIRGNHEFDFLCNRCGFAHEIQRVYNNEEIYASFIAAFGQMPLAALIDHRILCVHGGIGPLFNNLKQVAAITRPQYEFNDGLLDTMLWSDPSDTTEEFEASSRGTGYLFGEKALINFLDSNNLQMLIRAHECVMDGTQYRFNDRLITVFGASNYCGLVGNSSATIVISATGELSIKQFPPFSYLKRESVIFQRYGEQPPHPSLPSSRDPAPHVALVRPRKNTGSQSAKAPSVQLSRSVQPKQKGHPITLNQASPASKGKLHASNSTLIHLSPISI